MRGGVNKGVKKVRNYSTWEAKAGGSWVPGQPELHSETVSPKQKQETNNEEERKKKWQETNLT